MTTEPCEYEPGAERPRPTPGSMPIPTFTRYMADPSPSVRLVHSPYRTGGKHIPWIRMPGTLRDNKNGTRTRVYRMKPDFGGESISLSMGQIIALVEGVELGDCLVDLPSRYRPEDEILSDDADEAGEVAGDDEAPAPGPATSPGPILVIWPTTRLADPTARFTSLDEAMAEVTRLTTLHPGERFHYAQLGPGCILPIVQPIWEPANATYSDVTK